MNMWQGKLGHCGKMEGTVDLGLKNYVVKDKDLLMTLSDTFAFFKY